MDVDCGERLYYITIDSKIQYWMLCSWIHDYQDACVDKLENFITGVEMPPALSRTTSVIATPSSVFPSSPQLTRRAGLTATETATTKLTKEN